MSKINTKLDEARLRLDLPAGVKTVRPLENLGGAEAVTAGAMTKRYVTAH